MSKTVFEVREECAQEFEALAEAIEQGYFPVDPRGVAQILREQNCEEGGGHTPSYGSPESNRCRYCKAELVTPPLVRAASAV